MINNKKLIKYSSEYSDELSVDEELKKIRSCIQCGMCTSVCPSGNFTALVTRKVMRKALAGVHSVLSDPDIWYCSTCFNCYERCPRTIPVTNVILKLRNMAVREGYLPDALKNVIKNLANTGHAVPLGDPEGTWAKLREFHKLDKVPPTVHSFPEALDELFTLLDKIRFNARISYR